MVLNIMACVKHERCHMGRASCFPCVILLVGLVLTHDSYADSQSSADQVASGVLRTTKGHACPPQASLIHGRAVYLRNCQSCHGICGDGNGDYAPTLRIKPRDFTAGVYKWRSTPTGSLPTDEDLLRTLSKGIAESGMPAFAGMPEQDRRAVISYIKSLSPRFNSEPVEKPIPIPPEPAMTMESVTKGRLAYERMGCMACHGAAGNGWGPIAPNLADDDGYPIRPADLTGSTWKGGCQGEDIYRSIMTGLDGTPMPAFEKQLPPDEAWAMVHYIQSLDQR